MMRTRLGFAPKAMAGQTVASRIKRQRGFIRNMGFSMKPHETRMGEGFLRKSLICAAEATRAGVHVDFYGIPFLTDCALGGR